MKTPPDPKPSAWHSWFTRPSWGTGAMLLVMTLLAYGTALRGGYVWDDNDFVTHNPLLKEGMRGLWRLWFDLGSTTQYYPVAYTSFWLEYQVWGFSATGSHFVNVLLHGLNALLLWQALRLLRVPGAALAAFVFAVHPVEVESVAWITERKNVLSGAFYLAAFLAYFRFQPLTENPSAAPVANNRRWGWYAAALLLYLGALGSKTVTCSLPVALLLVLWWKQDRLRWRDVLPLGPFLAGGLGFGLLTAWMEKHFVGAQGQDWHLAIAERFLVAGRALWFYAGKLAWPADLIFIYPRWTPDAGVWWQWIFPATALALAVGLWLLRRRVGRGPVAAVYFFGITLFPALGFVDVYPFRYSFVADHFQYLASIGLLTLGAAGLAWSADKMKVGAKLRLAGCGLLLTTLAVLSWKQGRMYTDLDTFYTTILRQNPACWMAHNNLSFLRMERGDVAASIEHSQRSLALKADNPEAYVNLGNALVAKGQLDEAAKSYQAALFYRPVFAEAHSDLGNVLLFQGRLAEAIERYQEAIRIKPDYAEAQNNLGYALLRQGRASEAIPLFEKALSLRPDYAQAQENLRQAREQTKRTTP